MSNDNREDDSTVQWTIEWSSKPESATTDVSLGHEPTEDDM
jgi:hypothetical protein